MKRWWSKEPDQWSRRTFWTVYWAIYGALVVALGSLALIALAAHG